MESEDTSSSLSIFSSQKLRFSLTSDPQLKDLSEFKIPSSLQEISHHSFAEIVKNAFQWDDFGIKQFLQIRIHHHLICE